MLPVVCALGVITNKIKASLLINHKVNRYRFFYLLRHHLCWKMQPPARCSNQRCDYIDQCVYVLCSHLLGKGWPLGSRLWCLTVSLSLSHWYPGSGVVLDCIDSWSLHPYLFWLILSTKLTLNQRLLRWFRANSLILLRSQISEYD